MGINCNESFWRARGKSFITTTQMIHRLHLILCPLALTLLAGIVRAHGGPPLITDDPEVPGDGKWEINIILSLEQTRHSRSFDVPLLDINYGWGDSIQLKYKMPWVIEDEEGRGPRSGVGNTEAGVKWQFMHDEWNPVAMAVYPQFTFNTSSHSADDGIVDDGSLFFLPVEIFKEVGEFDMCAELGYEWVEHGDDDWQFGIAAGWPYSRTFYFLGEFRVEVDVEFRHPEIFAQVGMRMRLNDYCFLTGSVGHTFISPLEDKAELLTQIGLRFEF